MTRNIFLGTCRQTSAVKYYISSTGHEDCETHTKNTLMLECLSPVLYTHVYTLLIHLLMTPSTQTMKSSTDVFCSDMT